MPYNDKGITKKVDTTAPDLSPTWQSFTCQETVQQALQPNLKKHFQE